VANFLLQTTTFSLVRTVHYLSDRDDYINLTYVAKGDCQREVPKCVRVILSRMPIESRVYMADGLPILIEFDSASTAAEV